MKGERENKKTTTRKRKRKEGRKQEKINKKECQKERTR